jgi:hypothetical protein
MRRAMSLTAGSSSTTSTVSCPRALGAGELAFAAAGVGASCRGRCTRNVAPRPGALSTSMPPPLCATMPYTVESPSPVPLPRPFVVKNGSKTRARVAASMPDPVSVTASST